MGKKQMSVRDAVDMWLEAEKCTGQDFIEEIFHALKLYAWPQKKGEKMFYPMTHDFDVKVIRRLMWYIDEQARDGVCSDLYHENLDVEWMVELGVRYLWLWYVMGVIEPVDCDNRTLNAQARNIHRQFMEISQRFQTKDELLKKGALKKGMKPFFTNSFLKFEEVFFESGS